MVFRRSVYRSSLVPLNISHVEYQSDSQWTNTIGGMFLTFIRFHYIRYPNRIWISHLLKIRTYLYLKSNSVLRCKYFSFLMIYVNSLDFLLSGGGRGSIFCWCNFTFYHITLIATVFAEFDKTASCNQFLSRVCLWCIIVNRLYTEKRCNSYYLNF